MIDALFLSIIVASISFTVTEARLFKPIRVWIKKRNSFWGSFLLCGYCFGHWIAFALVAIYKPKLLNLWWPLDYFLTALVVAWLSALQWVLMCLLMDKAGK
jgi:hypothetical protein